MDNLRYSVKVQLEELLQTVREIRARSDRTSPDFNLTAARALFDQFKEHLREEHRKMSTAKGAARLSDAEKCWYQPAVSAAWANGISGARIDHQPRTWSEALTEAEHEFTWHLSNLNSTPE